MSSSSLVRMEYVDSSGSSSSSSGSGTVELASIGILNQLNITLSSSSGGKGANGKASIIHDDLGKEHSSSSSSTITVAAVKSSSSVIVEVRDSADCWIRIWLKTNDVIVIPAGVYRRIYSSDPSASIIDTSDKAATVTLRYNNHDDSIVVNKYHHYRELVCELCRQFFDAGWVTGTGGSISIRYGNRIYMTPSGVQKERIQPDELYVLDVEGEVLSVPNRKPGCRQPKLSDCSPLFLHAFKQRNAGAVLHSHSICTSMATCLFEGQSEFKISHQEMIKGIKGYGYFDELRIPIIENTAWEHELADSLGDAIRNNPKACAVLVRRHGMYVWGDTWEEAKRHGECLHYLFEVAIQMKKLGFDFNSPPLPLPLPLSLAVTNTIVSDVNDVNDVNANGKRGNSVKEDSINKRPKSANKQYKHYVFDIEGTTTPITFVKDVLFPYAADNARDYLESTWSTAQTKADVDEFIKQAALDAQDVSLKAPVIKTSTSPPSKSLIDPIVDYIKWSIENDRKVFALKNFQGHIWSQGYASGKIVSNVYDDVPACFSRLKDEGKQISIYSSGSREAQHLLFKHSNAGDLRRFIQCYFDTKIGNKRESSSYSEIALTLGVDAASDILFVTDIIEEAEAAAAVGIDVVLSVRPGNAKLPKKHNFKTVTHFGDL